MAKKYDPPKISGYGLYGPTMEDLLFKFEDNLLLGDFNINLLSDSRESLDFGEKIEDHALHVISKESTHFQGTSAKS
jgi:hypothetical protein